MLNPLYLHISLSKIKELLDLSSTIGRVLDTMPDGALVDVDLVVVAALFRLIAEEVNGCVVDAGERLLVCDVLEAVCLVPAAGEDVEGDLAANGVAG